MNHYLGKDIKVKITHPLGSSCGENKIYLTNFGVADDMETHVLGVYSAIDRYYGKVIGIIKGEKSQLIVANSISDYSKDQMIALLDYCIDFSKNELITLEYLVQSIRNSVRALIKKDNKYLFVRETYLEDEYYHLIGGGMNFLEKPYQALKREISEELAANLIEAKFLSTITNIFTLNDITAHEMMHLYQCEIDKEIKNGQLMTADIYVSELVWLSVERIRDLQNKILPPAIVDFILGHNLS